MAGRPRKTSIMKDITEIGTTKEKNAIEEVIKTVDIPKEEDKTFVTTSGVVKTDSWLNIRSAPSFSASVIGKLDNGETVSIYETKNGFGKIAILEDKWVSLEFIV